MSKIIAAAVLSAFAMSLSTAQYNPGSIQLGFSGSIGSRSYKTTGRYTDSGSLKVFYLGVSPSLYLAKGFSIDPEVMFSASKGLPPAWHFLANLSYTHAIEGSKVAPFIRAGYGVSNGMPALIGDTYIVKTAEELDVVVLNVGGGAKFLIAESVILRAEINYRNYGWTSHFGPSYSLDYSNDDFGLLVGFSIIIAD